MRGDAFLGRKFHVVAIHKAQHVVVVMWNGEVYPLKLQCRQWKDILGVARVMIRYAHSAGYDIRP